jgi:simple sugar transport system permease protein
MFFVILLITSLVVGFDPGVLFSDVLRRVLMFSILVLAMIPGVQSGIGMNFGISLGISAGLLGAVLSMEISYQLAIGQKNTELGILG